MLSYLVSVGRLIVWLLVVLVGSLVGLLTLFGWLVGWLVSFGDWFLVGDSLAHHLHCTFTHCHHNLQACIADFMF